MKIQFLDAVGMPYVEGQPCGGSELAQKQLADALARVGHDIKIAQQKGQRDLHETPDVVIVARMTTSLPRWQNIPTIVSLTDMGPHPVERVANARTVRVGVSRWQLDRFGGPGRVIPPIIEPPYAVEKIPNRYIYAGAAVKGLNETLKGWLDVRDRLPKGAHLVVANGGWGMPKDLPEWVTNLGALSPECMRAEIARSSYFLGARTYPETFCALAVIAEMAGTAPLMWCPRLKILIDGVENVIERTGLHEAISTPIFRDRDDWLEAIVNPSKCGTARNYSERRIVQMWENLFRDLNKCSGTNVQ